MSVAMLLYSRGSRWVMGGQVGVVGGHGGYWGVRTGSNMIFEKGGPGGKGSRGVKLFQIYFAEETFLSTAF